MSSAHQKRVDDLAANASEAEVESEDDKIEADPKHLDDDTDADEFHKFAG